MRRIVKSLCAIMCIALVAVCITVLDKENISTPTRNVELIEQSIDYQQSLNVFDDYEISTTGNQIELNGIKKISNEELSFIENLSEQAILEEDYFISFDIKYDNETNIVTIYASMNNELGELEMDEIHGVAFINEKGQIDAAMNVDGECILLSEMSDSGMIINCGWFKKLVKAVVVVATVTVVAVATVAVVVATAGVAAPALVAAGVGVTTAEVTALGIGLTAGYVLLTTSGADAIEAACNLDFDDLDYPNSSNSTSSASTGTPIPPNNNNDNKKSDKEKVKELSDDISDEFKQNYKCTDYANELEKGMKENGINGERVKIVSKTSKYISSDEFGMISSNEYHEGIKIGDTLFDNLRPNGIDYSDWLRDMGYYDFPNYFEIFVKIIG